ncbi:MAG TPA: hypothetical protein DEB38_01825, partial [Acidimicrobiaceae bacterium]|nr:hypothetical protein [Acidimicrobiaceae bacterium]
QLVVDTAAVVPFRGNDIEAAEFPYFRPLFSAFGGEPIEVVLVALEGGNSLFAEVNGHVLQRLWKCEIIDEQLFVEAFLQHLSPGE